jgi:hypothetical protein
VSTTHWENISKRVKISTEKLLLKLNIFIDKLLSEKKLDELFLKNYGKIL